MGLGSLLGPLRTWHAEYFPDEETIDIRKAKINCRHEDPALVRTRNFVSTSHSGATDVGITLRLTTIGLPLVGSRRIGLQVIQQGRRFVDPKAQQIMGCRRYSAPAQIESSCRARLRIVCVR